VESEHRFKVMADATPVLVWTVGPDKLVTFVNQAWTDFTGRPMEKDLGAGWREIMHQDDLDDATEKYVTAFDAQQPFVIKCRLRRHDGEYRWITSSGVPRYDAAGGFVGYVGACVDVTELQEKESALHESEERVSLAAEAAHLGVWELDCRSKQLWLSDKVCELFQFSPGQTVTYEEFQQRIHPDDRARREVALQRAMTAKGAYEIEYRVLLPDGTLRWVAGRGHCVNDGNGGSCRLLGVSMDITSRKFA